MFEVCWKIGWTYESLTFSSRWHLPTPSLEKKHGSTTAVPLLLVSIAWSSGHAANLATAPKTDEFATLRNFNN